MFRILSVKMLSRPDKIFFQTTFLVKNKIRQQPNNFSNYFFSKEKISSRLVATGCCLYETVQEAIRDESSHKAYRIEKGNNSLPTAKTARKKENKLKLFTLLKNDKEAFRPTDTDYYFENGLRKVRPYYHTFYTFTKKKWLGKSMREVFREEFRRCSDELLERRREEGQLTCNLQPIRSLDTKLTHNDLLTSTLHFHEGPVLDTAIKVLHDDSDYLVVDKPSSIPVHPVASYRFNSLVFILRKEYGYGRLHLCHRIDKATSGVVILAKSQAAAHKIASAIRDKKVEKEYVCKVVGEFPSDPKGIICDEVITAFDKKIGCSCAWKVDGFNWKKATTHFFRLKTDGNTSVLLCKPKTGRTHQIRVHLQYLGFPIVNDPMYNHEAWGEERFEHGPCTKSVIDVAMDIAKGYKFDPYFKLRALSENKAASSNDNTEIPVSLQGSGVSELCESCQKPTAEPDRDEITMFLHAYKYRGNDWNFLSPLPSWANLDGVR